MRPGVNTSVIGVSEHPIVRSTDVFCLLTEAERLAVPPLRVMVSALAAKMLNPHVKNFTIARVNSRILSSLPPFGPALEDATACERACWNPARILRNLSPEPHSSHEITP